MNEKLERCYGCGALVKALPGRPHPYIGASAGCWEVYGEILAKEYGEYGYPEPTHQLTVHTYAVQHPGEPDPRAIQSVNLHLIGLHLGLELGFADGPAIRRAFQRVVARIDDMHWLPPPVPNGTLTVLDVVQARDLDEHRRRVDAWARDVWQAWAAYHDLVRARAARYLA